MPCWHVLGNAQPRNPRLNRNRATGRHEMHAGLRARIDGVCPESRPVPYIPALDNSLFARKKLGLYGRGCARSQPGYDGGPRIGGPVRIENRDLEHVATRAARREQTECCDGECANGNQQAAHPQTMMGRQNLVNGGHVAGWFPRVDHPLMRHEHHVVAMSAERAYVPAVTPTALLTAEELFHVHIPDKRVELIRGVLVVRDPAGLRHGRVALEVARRLANHVEAERLGRVYAADTGFTLSRGPDTVRAPDVAFIAQQRLIDPEPVAYPDLAPDLAVEILSPGNRPGEMLAKVADWLSAGTRLVWVVDPERRVARVYREDGTEALVSADGTLAGEDVVPGFVCTLGDVL